MLSHRPATLADAELLCAWRNDALTRAMSRNTGLFTVEAMAARLVEPDRVTYVIEKDGVPVATTGFTYGHEVEFSITVAPDWRGRGLSREIAVLGVSLEPRSVAYIKAGNLACQKLLGGAGFRKVRGGSLQCWHYDAEAGHGIAASASRPPRMGVAAATFPSRLAMRRRRRLSGRLDAQRSRFGRTGRHDPRPGRRKAGVRPARLRP